MSVLDEQIIMGKEKNYGIKSFIDETDSVDGAYDSDGIYGRAGRHPEDLSLIHIFF